MSNADMSATKRALAAIESLQRKLDAIEQAQRESPLLWWAWLVVFREGPIRPRRTGIC